MRLVVADPTAPVVFWDDAQSHLKLDGFDDEQPIVEGFVAAATAHLDGADGWLGRNLSPRQVDLYLDQLTADLPLPLGPVAEVLSVQYRDPRSGTWTSVEPGAYETRGDVLVPGWRQSWPMVATGPETIQIRYIAGYETLPAPIRAALLLMTADLYGNRQTVETGVRAAAISVPMSTTVANLLAPYRLYA